MRFPQDLKYTRDHESAQVTGQLVKIGITDHAQSALGDIVYVGLPKVGATLKKGDAFGVVESIKAVSDLYAPVSGTVKEINTVLNDDPARVNRNAHGEWMIVVETTEPAPSDLMDAASYESFVATLK